MKGISVIVCCYNSAKRLPDTLGHIVKQRTSGFDWEVIVVDNASTDPTGPVATAILSKALPLQKFKVVMEMSPGLIYARKKGVETAQFDYLLFCDDDNWLADNYLQTAMEIMEQNQRMAILGGMGEPVFENGNRPTWFDEYGVNFAVGDQAPGSANDLTEVESVYGAGFLMRRSIFVILERSGFPTLLSGRKGKDVISGEDTELCFTVRFLGYEIWYSRQLRFQHLMTKERMNWAYLKKLHYGFGRTRLYTQIYSYVAANRDLTDNNLKYPLWLDKFIHRAKELGQFLPHILFKLNEEGNGEVLRYLALRGELYELYRIKGGYTAAFNQVAKAKKGCEPMKRNG